MHPQDELEQLLVGLMDGTPDIDRNRRLGVLLHEYPELQSNYLDYLRLHALLQWRAGNHAPMTNPQDPARNVQPAVMPISRSSRARWLGRGLVAAALLLAVSVGYLFSPSSPPPVTPDVVERLVDWNLDLAQTRSPDERQRIYIGQAADLQATVTKTLLPPEDRELAETLLENSSWLARNDDPMAAADRFNDIADKVVSRLDAATNAHDDKRIVLLANTYSRLMEVGVDANLERVIASGNLDVEGQKKLETAMSRGGKQAKKLALFMERNPDASNKAIRRAMKGRHRHHHAHPFNKKMK